MNKYVWLTGAVFFVAVIVIVGYGIGKSVLPRTNVGVPSYAPNGWKTYEGNFFVKTTNERQGIAFSYPRDFELREGDAVAGGFWGSPVAQVRFPQDAYQNPKTNFGEAYMTVSSGADQKTLNGCFSFSTLENPGAAYQRTVNNVVYQVATSTGVGAGNIYESVVYRTKFKQRCYEFALTVHTGNIQNYEPGTVQEFDSRRAFALLDAILGTVRFTDGNAL